jgi:hypothetical protein
MQLTTTEQPKVAKFVEITKVNVIDAEGDNQMLEVFLKDRFNGKPIYIESRAILEKIQPIL